MSVSMRVLLLFVLTAGNVFSQLNAVRRGDAETLRQALTTLLPSSSSSSSLFRPQSDHGSKWKRAACPGGEGNWGFNSFNFLSFVLQVYNVIANVNNNLNNNNNNDNDNNIDSISQDSNNVASTVNAGNQISVIVLPIPGRRRRSDGFNGSLKCGEGNNVTEEDVFAADLFNSAVNTLQNSNSAPSPSCSSLELCLGVQFLAAKLGSAAAVAFVLPDDDGSDVSRNKSVKKAVLGVNCRELFPDCSDKQ